MFNLSPQMADFRTYLWTHLSGSRAGIHAVRDYLLLHPPPLPFPPHGLYPHALGQAHLVLQHALEAGVPPSAPRHLLYVLNELLFVCGAASAPVAPAWLSALREASRCILPALLQRCAAAEPGEGVRHLAELLALWQDAGVFKQQHQELQAACWAALGLPQPPRQQAQAAQQQHSSSTSSSTSSTSSSSSQLTPP